MICYKPVVETNKLMQLYPNYKFNNDLVYGGYIGVDEGGNNVGNCMFSISGYNCSIISIDCDILDKLLVEGYIRASLNFCANRNAYMAHCDIESVADVLLLLGFKKNNDIYSGDIPTLLKGSCCK